METILPCAKVLVIFATLLISSLLVNPFTKIFRKLDRETARFPYWLPVAMGLGVAAYFSLTTEPSHWYIAATPALMLLTWASRSRWPIFATLLLLTFISLGFSAAIVEARLDERPMLDTEIPKAAVSGRVLQTDILPDGIRLTLGHPEIAGLPPAVTPEKIRIKANEVAVEDAPPTGADIHVTASLLPFSEPFSPHGPDFRRSAYYNHLGASGFATSAITIDDASPAAPSRIEAFSLLLEKMRKTLALHVNERLEGDVAAITAARLNGEQSAISAPVMDAMRVSGLAHLLATSGANVTVMGLLVYFPLRMLLALIPWIALRFPIKKGAAVGAVLSALAFTLLVGSPVATMRSMIMVGLAMLAITLDRAVSLVHLVMLSALIAMLFAPSAIMGASFEMSLAAVLCLVVFANDTHRKSRPAPVLPPMLDFFYSGIRPIVRVSLIAMLAITPISIYQFQTLNIYGVISNIIAIPLASFWVMPFTILAYIAAPFNADGFFIDMAALGNALTIRIATTVAHWPHAVLSCPAMPSGAFIAIILGGFWLCLWREKWRYLGIIPILIGFAYPFSTQQPDVFVAPNGKGWGVVMNDGRLIISNRGRNKFAAEQWQQSLGNPATVDARGLSENDKQLQCSDLGCTFHKNGWRIAMPLSEVAIAEACGKADVVIAPFPIGDCLAKHVIDSTALYEHGAYTLTLIDGIKIDYARDARGLRPWSPGWREKEIFD